MPRFQKLALNPEDDALPEYRVGQRVMRYRTNIDRITWKELPPAPVENWWLNYSFGTVKALCASTRGSYWVWWDREAGPTPVRGKTLFPIERTPKEVLNYVMPHFFPHLVPKPEKPKKNALFSSCRHDYETPPDLFKLLDDEFHFECDLAASKENAKCAKYFDVQSDALDPFNVWEGVCFLNPPFGVPGKVSQIERGYRMARWMRKAVLCSHVNGATIVALIPARTDTRWFLDYVNPYAEIRFVNRRLRFGTPDGKKPKSATFPSIVAIFRPRPKPEPEGETECLG